MDMPYTLLFSVHGTNISQISSMAKFHDYVVTKLARLLMEVPTRHRSCGKFMFLFPKCSEIHENLSHE